MRFQVATLAVLSLAGANALHIPRRLQSDAQLEACPLATLKEAVIGLQGDSCTSAIEANECPSTCKKHVEVLSGCVDTYPALKEDIGAESEVLKELCEVGDHGDYSGQIRMQMGSYTNEQFTQGSVLACDTMFKGSRPATADTKIHDLPEQSVGSTMFMTAKGPLCATKAAAPAYFPPTNYFPYQQPFYQQPANQPAYQQPFYQQPANQPARPTTPPSVPSSYQIISGRRLLQTPLRPAAVAVTANVAAPAWQASSYPFAQQPFLQQPFGQPFAGYQPFVPQATEAPIQSAYGALAKCPAFSTVSIICVDAAPTPAPTPRPTPTPPTPKPTAAPKPTEAPKPTAAPKPTEAPKPTAAPVAPTLKPKPAATDAPTAPATAAPVRPTLKPAAATAAPATPTAPATTPAPAANAAAEQCAAASATRETCWAAKCMWNQNNNNCVVLPAIRPTAAPLYPWNTFPGSSFPATNFPIGSQGSFVPRPTGTGATTPTLRPQVIGGR